MKIKEGFILRTVAKEHVVVAIGEASSILNGIIKLNDTGAFLWGFLKSGANKDRLVLEMQKKYKISEEVAQRDVDAFLYVLYDIGCLEEG